MGIPQLVNLRRQLQNAVAFILREGLAELLVPLLDEGDLVRLQSLDDLVGIAAHARIACEEVVHLFGKPALLARFDALGRVLIPDSAALWGTKLVKGIALPPRTDQAVAVDNLRAEPRHIAALIDGV